MGSLTWAKPDSKHFVPRKPLEYADYGATAILGCHCGWTVRCNTQLLEEHTESVMEIAREWHDKMLADSIRINPDLDVVIPEFDYIYPA